MAVQAMERAAGFVISRKLGSEFQYLMMQTSYGKHHWTPPKGHVEGGENDYETAIRETEEESGLIAGQHFTPLKDFKHETNYQVKGRPKVVVYWLAELNKEFDDTNDPVKMSDEHQDYKWLPIEEAVTIGDYKEMENLLRACHQYLTSRS